MSYVRKVVSYVWEGAHESAKTGRNGKNIVFLFRQVLKPDGFMDAVFFVGFENLTR